ncbi:MAG TPA: DUF72 domain-containing protein [Steroidobacteraceae bacterium]|nr:DUF72 domain-containing protein [Steroidobacteraceae bacterium]
MILDPSTQIELFAAGGSDVDLIGTAPLPADLADAPAHLPPGLKLGTSSWAFPGWAGVVYAHRAGEQLLARAGLGAYARHALLGAVGLDRTFYAPLSAEEFRRYAWIVPSDFRFVVKAHAALTTPVDRQARNVAVTPDVDRFLDVRYAIERIVTPAAEGLGDRLGALLFQFPPLGLPYAREPQLFVSALGAFLEALPRGPQYAVEIRNKELLGPEYSDALARSGATHCFNVHPRMPSVLEQAEVLGENAWLSGAVVIRWLLHPGQDYEAARERYFPFDRIVDPDPGNRAAVAALLDKILARGNEALVIANNKAEGCAPVTLFGLVRELERRAQPPSA